MAKPQKQDEEVLVVDINKILTPLAIVTSSVLVSIVLLIGLLSINSTLKNFDSYTKETKEVKAEDTTQEGETPTVATEANIDDDAKIGSSDAKVALIEFSDYNCTYCQKYHSETFDQIKKDYVDNNKILYVYRDFPGVGGDTTLATASTAECVREQKDDSAFFDFIKKVYSGGTDRNDINKLTSFAKELGLDEGKFKSCAESGKYKDEVNKDLADAMALGIGGTPSFYVGKLSSDGTVEGEVLVGAQPYATFQATLDKYLN